MTGRTVIDIRPDSFEDLVDRAMKSIGEGTCTIVLQEPNKEACLQAAVQWFVRWRGQSKIFKTAFVAGQTEYELPEDCMFVYDVIFPQPNYELPFPDMYEYPEAYYWGELPDQYSYVLQLIQRREMGKRILSHEADWEMFKTDRGPMLRITPTEMYIDVGTGLMWISYKSSKLNLRVMDATDLSLLERRIKAEIKYTEGRLLSKMSSWPGPGGDVTTDGDTLRTEGSAELETLDEEAKNLSWPIPFMQG